MHDYPEAVQARSRSEVFEALDRAQLHLDRLGKQVDQFRERLDPLLRPSVPRETDSAVKAGDEPMASALAQRINSHAHLAYSLGTALEGLLERLDLP